MPDANPNMREARKLKLFPWIVTSSRFAAARKVADIFAFDFFSFSSDERLVYFWSPLATPSGMRNGPAN